jgi:ribosomal protein S18 acetylase RimI-like enzyme
MRRQLVLTRPLLRSDVPSLVPVHRAAFAGHVHGRLGDAYAAGFLRFFAQDAPTRRTIGIVVVDERGALCGYVCGVEQEHAKDLVAMTRPHGARALAARPWLWFHPDTRQKVVGQLQRRLGATPNDEPPTLRAPVMGLYAIGVSSLVRGKGVAQVLLRAFEQQALHMQMGTMLLSVFEHNAPAIAAYERAGWRRCEGRYFDGRAAYFEKSLG